jgi:uncharacterized membrane protein
VRQPLTPDDSQAMLTVHTKVLVKVLAEDLMNLPRFVAAIVVTLFLVSSVMHAAKPASCTFDTFSAPSGYSFSQVNGVSDDGTVVGQLIDSSTQQSVAFTRSASGVFTEYAAPKSSSTWLYGRNGSGMNAGFYQDKVNPENVHGFLLQGSQFTAVNHPKATNTWLFDVNQLGASVGSFSTSPSQVKGFMLLNGNYTTIAYPNAQSTYALAINDNGDVVGTYASTAVSNGFLWQSGTFTTINYPHASYGTVLAAVNNSGVIVGNRLTADKDFGFIYENGVFKNIVYSGAKFTMAGGINNNGLISGQIYLTASNTLGYTAVCK